MSAKRVETVPESGTRRFTSLSKPNKSPRNARKTPRLEAAIEAYAASIAANGILQNLVLEPEIGNCGTPTVFYLANIGAA